MTPEIAAEARELLEAIAEKTRVLQERVAKPADRKRLGLIALARATREALLLLRLEHPALRRGSATRCSFCFKISRDVRKLVAGLDGRICDECVALCVSAIEDDGGQADGQRRTSNGQGRRTPARTPRRETTRRR